MAITGIGGFFFRAANPKVLREWYQKHFGVIPDGYEPWMQASGPTMIVPFPQATDNIPAGKQWMINFRVRQLRVVPAPPVRTRALDLLEAGDL